MQRIATRPGCPPTRPRYYRPRHAAPCVVRPYVLVEERRRRIQRQQLIIWETARQRRAVAARLSGTERLASAVAR
ncbi:hypothetical protein [Allosalinactinospora lopnorensis]|uniref:hypothetical protein n=1 Tax=Allosalinactinospora lopnorensis TaxID=1352348 RepID=UPI0012E2D5BF|nr:hypothetical protein [Allosalinactinospora lopnorensis]